jgi:hypothetical protein
LLLVALVVAVKASAAHKLLLAVVAVQVVC